LNAGKIDVEFDVSSSVLVSRLTRVEKAVINTTIIVTYKVLVYKQMSQPTTCFGLF